MGLTEGNRAPGQPSTEKANWAIASGTGAFLGARGQVEGTGSTGQAASVAEDPANRRVNGGNPNRYIAASVVSGAHALTAGAGITGLKAAFNKSFVIPNPVMPSDDGLPLAPYTGAALTVGGELNKPASNIALQRDAAGVHYRSDGVEGIKLGEAIAISILRDTAMLFNEVFPGFSLTKYDGTRVTICPNC